MTPRRARLHHLPALARILWADHRRARWSERLCDLRSLTRLMRRGQVMVIPGRVGPRGFLARDGAAIHALYVHPRARRQGLASRLLEQAQSGATRLELWTAQSNHAARALYAAHGFHPVELTLGHGNDEGRPDMRLVWKRNAP